MAQARTVYGSSPQSLSSGSAEGAGAAARALVVAAIAALMLGLLGFVHLGTGGADGYPDPTHQWTD